MDIKLPTSYTPPSANAASGKPALPAAASPALSSTWQAGQIFEALVLKAENPQELLLNIQGITAKVLQPPQLPFRPGQTLAVELIETGTPPQFRLLPAKGAEFAELNQALRTQLPRQQPLPPLLANIEYLVRRPDAKGSFPREIHQLAQQLYFRLPEPAKIRQPADLKQALQNSGFFLEHKLEQVVSGRSLQAEPDLRTTLLRLAGALKILTEQPPKPALSPLPTPQTPVPAHTPAPSPDSRPPAVHQPPPGSQTPLPQPKVAANLNTVPPQAAAEELRAQVEGVLARLHVQQLQSLKSEEQGRPMWSLELPVRSDRGLDLFDLRIQREPPYRDAYSPEDESQQGRDAQAEHKWTVRLAFDLEGLGPVYATVSLQAQQVSVAFNAERVQTSSLLSQHLDVLSSRLRHSGLEVGGLDCQHGLPEAPPPPPPSPLVDEKA